MEVLNSWLRHLSGFDQLTWLALLLLLLTKGLLLLSLLVALGAEAVGDHGPVEGLAVGAQDASVVVVLRFHPLGSNCLQIYLLTSIGQINLICIIVIF